MEGRAAAKSTTRAARRVDVANMFDEALVGIGFDLRGSKRYTRLRELACKEGVFLETVSAGKNVM